MLRVPCQTGRKCSFQITSSPHDEQIIINCFLHLLPLMPHAFLFVPVRSDVGTVRRNNNAVQVKNLSVHAFKSKCFFALGFCTRRLHVYDSAAKQ